MDNNATQTNIATETGTVESNIIIQKITATQEFATLPTVAMKVLSLLEDDFSLDMRELSKLIETDASLTMKLIQTANSPIFAIGATIKSVQQAIVTLGLNRISNIAVAISVFSKFIYAKGEDMQKLLEKYWSHTSAVATVSKSLAKRIGLNFKESEFLGGLLHDIGKLAMLQYDLDMYKKVIYLVNNQNKTDSEAEIAVYGVDHCAVGFEIANKWKLPESLSEVILHHYDFAKANDKMKPIIAVVNVANLLCGIWEQDFFEGVRQVQFSELEEWKYLEKITEGDLDIEEITFALEKDYEDSAQFISIVKN